MSTESAKSLKLFYCYAREDKVLRDELDKHLSDLKREYQIASWSDGEIIPGAEWQKEIDAQLNTANIILLLISAYFMASDYCYGIEMKRALERHEADTARVIPIIVRDVYYWENAPFSKLQALPTNAKPVTQWSDRDEAFRNITMGIRHAIIALAIPLKTKEEPHSQRAQTEIFRSSKPQSMTFDSITNKTGEPMRRRVYGGVEGGGTKFNCMIGADPYRVLVRKTFPITDPQRTLDEVASFFQQEQRGHELAAIGVGPCGPIDLNPASATYGYITTTPKSGWEYTNIVGIPNGRILPLFFGM